jgi:hypothetical protein
MGRDIMQHGHGLASISRFDRMNGYKYAEVEALIFQELQLSLDLATN